jgi:hypothetical protein
MLVTGLLITELEPHNVPTVAYPHNEIEVVVRKPSAERLSIVLCNV